MYKYRFKKWGVRKNIREHKAYTIVHVFDRRSEGKLTETLNRGRPNSIEKARSHLRRKQAVVSKDVQCRKNDLNPNPMCRMPEYCQKPLQAHETLLSARSLSANRYPRKEVLAVATIPRVPKSPEYLRVPESLFQQMQIHVLACVGGRADEHSKDENLIRLHFICACLVRETMERACYAYHNHHPAKAANLLTEGFVHLQTLVGFHSIASTFYLTGCIALLLSQQQNEKAASICRQICHTSHQRHLGDTPGGLAFRELFLHVGLLAQRSDTHEFLLPALRSLTDSLNNSLGQEDPLTIASACMQSRIVRDLYGSQGVLENLEHLYDNILERNGQTSIQTAIAYVELRTYHFECAYYVVSSKYAQLPFKKGPPAYTSLKMLEGPTLYDNEKLSIAGAARAFTHWVSEMELGSKMNAYLQNLMKMARNDQS